MQVHFLPLAKVIMMTVEEERRQLEQEAIREWSEGS